MCLLDSSQYINIYMRLWVCVYIDLFCLRPIWNIDLSKEWLLEKNIIDFCFIIIIIISQQTLLYRRPHWRYTCTRYRVVFLLFLFLFFSVRLLSVLRGHSFFFIAATTANDLRLRRIFDPRCYPLHYFPFLILEREPVFPFFNVQC